MPHLICNKNFERNGNFATAAEILDSAVQNKDESSFVIIVPTVKQVKQLSFSFIRKFFATHGMPCSPLNIYTLEQFIKILFLRFYDNRNFHFISDSYRAVLIEEAMHKTDLKFYSKGSNDFKFSVVDRIAGVINGLKEDGVIPESLMVDALGNGNISNPEKLIDLAGIFKEYNRFLGNRLTDLPTALTMVNQKLTDIVFALTDARSTGKSPASIFDELFKKESIIFCEGFTDLKVPEIEFLTLLGKLDNPFAIGFDFHEGKGPLFGNIREIIDKFRENNFSIIPKYNNIDKNIFSQKEFLRENLFEIDPASKSKELSNKIKIIKAESKHEEIQFAAKLIKKLVADGQIQFNDACIVSRSPGEYADIIREIFYSERIPVNVTDRFELSKSPVTAAIFSLIHTISKGYQRNDVLNAISNPFFDYSNIAGKSNAKKINPEYIATASLKLRITGGKNRGGSNNWKLKLKKAIKIYENYINEEQFPFNSPEMRELEHYLIVFKQALDDFEAFTKFLGESYKKITVGEFVKIVRFNIIEKLGLINRISIDYTEIKSKLDKNQINDYEFKIQCEEIEKNARALDAFLDVLDEMAFVLTEVWANKTFSFEELTARLEIAVKAAKYQIKEKEEIGVLATSIEQTRGLPFKVSILCGAVDGAFPLGFSTDTFLGKSIPGSEERHLRSEQIQFYQFLTLNSDIPDRQFYITYPNLLNEDSESTPSSFISFLAEITNYDNRDVEIDLQKKSNEFSDLMQSITSIPDIFTVIPQEGLTDQKLLTALNRYSLLNSAFYVNEKYVPIKEMINNFQEHITQFNDWLSSKSYSVTEFEDYASCPYKYFAKRVLKISDADNEEITLSALDTGNFLHTVAMRFFLELQTRVTPERSSWIIPNNTPALPYLKPVTISSENYHEYHELLYSIAREEIERIRYDHPYFDIEESKIFGNGEIPGLLEYWLSTEIYKAETLKWDYYPSLFEVSFTDRVEPGSFDSIDVDGKFKLTGKIDRIEINKADPETFGFLIADYKTTKNGFKKIGDMIKGRSFQMPLYTYAAEKILQESYQINAKPAKAVYYAFSNPKSSKLFEDILLVSFEQISQNSIENSNKKTKSNQVNIEELVTSSINMADTIIKKISDRNFPVMPLPQSCAFCDFASICRINEKNQ